tara:strand:+ start:739 stop:1332 length:594 start_codon:yes stop_codon:yes gene_type:complete
MQLRELKKEIEGLSHINKTLLYFKESWIKQIKPNTNRQFPFLQCLDEKTKKRINNHLSHYPKLFQELKYVQYTQEKLASLAQYLIELKLSSLNGDENKPKILVSKFIHDDYLKLKNLVDEVQQLEFNINNLKILYDKVNRLLLRNLPLEHSITFMDSPHKNYLNSLLLVSKKKKKLLKGLGKEFVSLTKQMKKNKKL